MQMNKKKKLNEKRIHLNWCPNVFHYQTPISFMIISSYDLKFCYALFYDKQYTSWNKINHDHTNKSSSHWYFLC